MQIIEELLRSIIDENQKKLNIEGVKSNEERVAVDEIKNDYEQKLRVKDQQINILQNQNNTLLNNIKHIQQQYGYLLTKHNDKESKLKQLQDDHKELKNKYNKIIKNKDNNNKNNNYQLWNAHDITSWIIKLNESKYIKYKDDLLSNMTTEGIDGSSLKDLDINDLHRLGISGFKDKKYIFKKIQQL